MALLVKRGLTGPLALLDYLVQWYAMVPLRLHLSDLTKGGTLEHLCSNEVLCE